MTLFWKLVVLDGTTGPPPVANARFGAEYRLAVSRVHARLGSQCHFEVPRSVHHFTLTGRPLFALDASRLRYRIPRSAAIVESGYALPASSMHAQVGSQAHYELPAGQAHYALTETTHYTLGQPLHYRINDEDQK